jgi:hypothetical protein
VALIELSPTWDQVAYERLKCVRILPDIGAESLELLEIDRLHNHNRSEDHPIRSNSREVP